MITPHLYKRVWITDSHGTFPARRCLLFHLASVTLLLSTNQIERGSQQIARGVAKQEATGRPKCDCPDVVLCRQQLAQLALNLSVFPRQAPLDPETLPCRNGDV